MTAGYRLPDFRYLGRRPVVYRVFDAAGRLIYVGQSINLHARVREHCGQSWWWKPLAHRIRIEMHPTVESAKAAEKVAIQEETPVFNAMGYGNWRENPHWSQADIHLHNEHMARFWAAQGKPYLRAAS